MRYTLIAATMIGAVFAMPAAPASYGEAPAAYGSDDSEQVYGTQVSNMQPTTAAAIASSTCTDEAENIVPYTSAVAQSMMGESSMMASSAMMSSESSPLQTESASSEASGPAGYASGSMMGSNSPAMQTGSASSSMTSQEMPAGYASGSMGMSSSTGMSPSAPVASGSLDSPKGVASASGAAPMSPEQSMMNSAPAGYAASSSMPQMAQSSMAATGESLASPQMPAEQYGATVVPGSAPTQAPYPIQGESNASPAMMATGTMGAAMPSGTGSVTGSTQQFEGAASSVTVAGLFVSFGAIAALFM